MASFDAVAGQAYDVVIVGSGVSGSIIARELGRQGCRLLMLEAWSGNDITVADHEESVPRFHGAVAKDNNSACAKSRHAPLPRDHEARKLQSAIPNADGYLVQTRPLEIDSTHTRVLGGTAPPGGQGAADAAR